jgi:hypothetical protein
MHLAGTGSSGRKLTALSPVSVLHVILVRAPAGESASTRVGLACWYGSGGCRPREVSMQRLVVALCLSCLASCGGQADPVKIALQPAGRDATLLAWLPRGDLTSDRKVVEYGIDSVVTSDPHRRAVLFAGQVPGGVVVITQITERGQARPFTAAGQYPLADDGTPLLGSLRTLLLPPQPVGLSAVLQVPDRRDWPGSPATLLMPEPFLLLSAGPDADGVSFGLVDKASDTAPAAWEPVQLHDGSATVQLPPGTTGDHVRVRWLHGMGILSQGKIDTDYPL